MPLVEGVYLHVSDENATEVLSTSRNDAGAIQAPSWRCVMMRVNIVYHALID
jgi:hypothetical protein